MKSLTLFILAGLLMACAAPSPGPAALATQYPPAPAAAEPPAPHSAPAASVLLVQWAGEKQQIVLFDSATGLPVAGYEPIEAAPAARSADGRWLAAVEMRGQTCDSFAGGASCRPSAVAVDVVDVANWAVVARVTLPPNGWVGPVAFSPDASRLAVAHHNGDGDSLLAADAATGEVTAQRPLAFQPALLVFGAEGRTVAAYGVPPSDEPGISQPPPPSVAVLAAGDLEAEWEASLDGVLSGNWCLQGCDSIHELWINAMWTPGAAAAPDGSKLYLVHADADRLTTVDFAGQSVTTVDIQPDQAWIERLLALTAGTAQAKGPMEGALKSAVLSPDGTRLYTIGTAWRTPIAADGDWAIEEEALGLQAIEAATGRLLGERENLTGDLSLTADGSRLLLHNWPLDYSLAFTADSLEVAGRLGGWQAVAARQADGQPVLLAVRYENDLTGLGLLDPATFHLLQEWSVDGYASWLAGP